jgi:hypothetical protein
MVVLALGSSPGAKACALVLIQDPGTVIIDYNPFAIGPSAGALSLKLKNQGENDCDLRLSFVHESGGLADNLALGGVGMQFRPRESSGVRASDITPGTFNLLVPKDTTAEAQFDAATVIDVVPEAGTYAADIKLLVQDAEGNPLLPSIPVRVQLVSTPRAQLGLAGAAGAFGSGSSVEVVDFGDAVTGATRNIFVQVRANAPSTLTIKSEHRGTMRRLGDVTTESNLPYAIQLDGEAVDLAAPWARAIDPPRTLAGASLPMLFTLGTVNDQMAGRYQDVVTIDISPN